jgi:hypothetical protein
VISDAGLYALAWTGVILLWVLVIAWYAVDAGLDVARIPHVGPAIEQTWNAIVAFVRTILRMKQ